MKRSAVLDRAKNHTGSDKATADAIGASFQNVRDWRNDRRAIPEAKRFDLAEVAQLSKDELIAWLQVEAKWEKKATTAASVVAFAGSLGIAFALSAGLHGDKPELTEPNIVGSEYTLWRVLRWLSRRVRTAAWGLGPRLSTQ